MEYIKIPLYGKYGKGKYALVDGDYDGEYFSQYKWYLSATGYPIRVKNVSKNGNRVVYLHHEVLRCNNAKVGHIVRDHIDGNKLNNRSCNLKIVTQSENISKSSKAVLVTTNGIDKITLKEYAKRNNITYQAASMRLSRGTIKKATI